MDNELIVFKKDNDLTVGITPFNVSQSMEYISNNDVKNIFFEGKQQFNNFDFLKLCNVESVSINNSDIDTSKIPIMKTVKKLFLNQFDGVLSFLKFPNLNECSMDWNNRIKIMENACNIEKLTIWNYKPKSKSLIELVLFEKIKYLKISQTNITSLEHIDYFSNIIFLELHYIPNLLSLEYIDLLEKTLKTLFIDHAKKLCDYSKLPYLSNLETLALGDCGNIDSIKFIDRMPKLRDFRFVNTNILDGDLKPCFRLENVGFLPKKHYSNRPEDFVNK